MGLEGDAIRRLSTGVCGLRQVLGKGHGGGIEAAGIDPLVRERHAGGGIVNDASDAFRLATGAVERAEVACEGGGGGDKSGAGGGGLTNIGLLKTAKEKQLVAEGFTSDGSAELVAPQTVLPRGEIICGVDGAVADGFKSVAMPASGNRLGDGNGHT